MTEDEEVPVPVAAAAEAAAAAFSAWMPDAIASSAFGTGKGGSCLAPRCSSVAPRCSAAVQVAFGKAKFETIGAMHG